MQASLTLPPEANLTAGDNPVYIGNMSIGESITINWTIVFTTSGVFTLDVNASGFNENTGEPVEKHGTAQVTARKIKILSPVNATYSANTVLLTFFVVEPVSSIGYNLNGQANMTTVGNTTLTELPDGTHYLNLYGNYTPGEIESDRVYFTIDTTHPNITDVSQSPLKGNVLPDDIVKVSSTVTDNLRVKQVTLNYTDGNGTWIVTGMEKLEENIWNATISPFPYRTNITYTILAMDYANNTITTEELGYELVYQVIPEIPTSTLMTLLLLVTTIAAILLRKIKPSTSIHRQ